MMRRKRKKEEEEEPAAMLVSRKRSRETTAADIKVAQKTGEVPRPRRRPSKKGVVFKDPLEPAQKKTKVTIKPFKTGGVESE
ncbi:hypothetical protein Hanom_Chr06g00504471 [Helianthus anomalus]